MLSGCPQTPPENAPGGTLETPPRDRPAAPGKGTEKDHSVQLVNHHRAVGDSSRKWRVGSIRTIAQSPSHSLSHPLKGMASQQLQLAVAGSQCELPYLGRSATEAQLGLGSEHEDEFALDAGFEFAFESERDDSNSNLRWRVSSRSDSSSSSSCNSF